MLPQQEQGLSLPTTPRTLIVNPCHRLAGRRGSIQCSKTYRLPPCCVRLPLTQRRAGRLRGCPAGPLPCVC
jgi:hypothetical protein